MKYLLKDGNLSGFAIIVLLVVGLLLVYACVSWIESYLGRLASFSVGLVCVASAGYAGRAKALGLRPFGESPWRKAKRTYEEKDK
ncbi:hypothetical protein CTP10_R48720 [Cupriavidus sp. P-10]|uniref:hypothetical protein n=1 Tax=unclassified Cupriavidus TaxID=2640874 RepID=UPI0011C12DCF|nr:MULTISPECIES: hypothetical protein [unclassified Cupriavidus]BDB27464.1 hypothetical protein CTP10_R48720 [Cupriavidus sp. P-10]